MNDPDIIGEPMTLREIHAIRLMLSDEIKSMPEEERTDYFNKRTEAFVERCGFKIQHRESSKSFKIVNDL
jgi:hypothetical protein